MAQGFDSDFFEEVLGRSRKPVRDFMADLSPTASASQFGAKFGAPTARGPGLFTPDPLMFISPQSWATSRLAPKATPTPNQPSSPSSSSSSPLQRAYEAAAKKSAPTTTPGDESDVSVDQSSPWYARAAAIASEEGLDPRIFTRLVGMESKYNPNAVSARGARGLAQLMPETAAELGVNPDDPEQNLRGGAKYLKQMLDKYGGDYNLALAAYNAGPGTVDQYGGIPPFQDTQAYVRRIMGTSNVAPTTAQGQPNLDDPSSVRAVPEPAPGVRPLRGITPYQYGDASIPREVADYICGPVAAVAFARANGRNPTLVEALDMARGIGVIDPANGMHGVESTAQLIRKLGGNATVQYRLNRDEIVNEIRAGRPVIINTDAGAKGHYFVIEDYDENTGRFEFGNSARALRASQGNTQYTLEEIRMLGFGSPNAAIYAR